MAISTYNCPYGGELLRASFPLPPYPFVLKMHIWRVPYPNFFFQFISPHCPEKIDEMNISFLRENLKSVPNLGKSSIIVLMVGQWTP